MGNQCNCLNNDPRDEREEFKIGSGVYSFKKGVNIIILFYFYINSLNHKQKKMTNFMGKSKNMIRK